MRKDSTRSTRILVSVTGSAMSRIRELQQQANDVAVVASVTWVRIDNSQEWQVAFGFHDRSEVNTENLVNVDGLEIFVAIPPSVIHGLKKKELDYDGSKFFLT